MAPCSSRDVVLLLLFLIAVGNCHPVEQVELLETEGLSEGSLLEMEERSLPSTEGPSSVTTQEEIKLTVETEPQPVPGEVSSTSTPKDWLSRRLLSTATKPGETLATTADIPQVHLETKPLTEPLILEKIQDFLEENILNFVICVPILLFFLLVYIAMWDGLKEKLVEPIFTRIKKMQREEGAIYFDAPRRHR